MSCGWASRKMATIEALILDGRITLVAIAVLVLEMVCLFGLRRHLSMAMLLANGLAGISLIMALRSALLGPDVIAVAVWLGLGLIAHLGDVILRLRR